MLSFRLAARFLSSGRTQTLLIISGIAIAIAVQVFIGLLIGSLQRGLVDRTVGNAPQVTIEAELGVGATISQWQTVLDEVRQVDGVTTASPSAAGSAFVAAQDRQTPAQVRGLDLDEAEGIYGLRDAVYEGSVFKETGEVLVGRQMAEALQLEPGDTLRLLVPEQAPTDVTVAGLYDLRVAEINERWVVTGIATAQSVFALGDEITAIEVAVEDVFAADAVAENIGTRLGRADLSIGNWKERNQELLDGLEGQQISSLVIQGAIIASVVIAIASILAISVLQKRREIGILKAMGIKDRDASRIFLYQGFLIGLVGSIAGILLGLGLLYAFTSYLAREGDPLIAYEVDLQFLLLSWFIAVTASTLAGVIPARRSARLSPVEVINEG